ncbi:MAG: SprT-like domain-containing protein [Spirochaetales bacterium]
MNQDQVKELLLQLEPDTEEFQVIFSGKQSKRVNGIYHPESREIILHNRNFKSETDLLYTAIHEFAHHLHFIRSPVPITNRSHTQEFWALFHDLLDKAEKVGIYTNVFEREAEFRLLTDRIRTSFLSKNGHLMKEFGKLLTEAEALCRRYNARFEDYVDRVLGVHRTTARVLMRIHSLNVDPEIGFENMRTVASLKTEEERKLAEEAFRSGKSPDRVKAEFSRKRKEVNPLERLKQEKRRIEKTIQSLAKRLEDIEKRLSQFPEEEE